MKLKLGIVGLVVFALIFFLIRIWSGYDVVEIDGEKFKYAVYDVSLENLTFSRSDQNPHILDTYPWIASASLSYGGAFMTSSSVEKLNSYFESPPKDVKKGVAQLIGNGDLSGEITVVSVEKFLVRKEWMLLVGVKRSDFPAAVKFSRLVEVNGRWVLASGARDPNGNLVKLLGRLSDEAHRRLEAGNSAPISLSRL